MHLKNTASETPDNRTPIAAPHGHREHTVQFYEDEAFLYEAVADFLGRGMVSGLPGLVISAADRHEGLVRALDRRGTPPREWLEGGRYAVRGAVRAGDG